MRPLLENVWVNDASMWMHTLMEITLKATMLLALAFVFCACVRRSTAALRHRVWALSFIGLLSIPPLSILLPPWNIRPQQASPNTDEMIESAAKTATPLPGAQPDDSPPGVDASRRTPPPTADHTRLANGALADATLFAKPTKTEEGANAGPDALNRPLLFGVVWAVGALLSLIPWLFGHIHCLRLQRSCGAMKTPKWVDLLRDCSAKLRLRRSVILLSADCDLMPMTCGLIRPVVIFPRGADAWPDARRRAVLLHELAHVKRWDVLLQMVARLSCSLYWFHPLGWLGMGRMRIDRELASDDCVLAAGEKPSCYAAQLLDVVKAHRSSLLLAGVTMAGRLPLEGRITAVLDRKRKRRPVGAALGLAMSVMAVLIVTPLAMLAWGAKAVEASADPTPSSKQAPAKQTRDETAEDPLPPGALLRFGSSRFRHGTAIRALAVSRDGRLAVAASGNHYLGGTRAFDLTNGRMLYKFDRSAGFVEAVALSPSGETLAARVGTTVHLYDAKTGKEQISIQLSTANPRSITQWMTFSPDGKLLACASTGKKIDLVNLDEKKIIRTLPHNSVVFTACFSPDGKKIAAGGYDSEKSNYFARLWETETGKELKRFYKGRRGFRSLAFSPDGEILAGGGDDARLRLWSVETGEVQKTFAPDGYRIRSVAWAPDGQTVAAAGEAIRLYDRKTGRQRLRIDRKASGLHFSAQGEILTAAVDGAIHRWETASGRPLTPQAMPDSAIDQIVTTRDGRLVLTQDEGGYTHVWDGRSGKHIRRLKVQWQRGIAVSPNGKYLATSFEDPMMKYRDSVRKNVIHTGSRIRLFDLTANQRIDRFPGFEGDAHQTMFAPDGKSLLTVDRRTGRVRVWDFAQGKLKRTLRILREGEEKAFYPVSLAALSPDGKTLAVTYDRFDRTTAFYAAVFVRLWDMASGKELHELTGHMNGVRGLAFSPDNKLLVTCNENPYGPYPKGRPVTDRVFIWRVATGERIAEAAEGLPIGAGSVVFSPDGRTLATASSDGALRLWDTTTWKKRKEYRGHRGRISMLHYGADGRLFSGGMDAVTIAWKGE